MEIIKAIFKFLFYILLLQPRVLSLCSREVNYKDESSYVNIMTKQSLTYCEVTALWDNVWFLRLIFFKYAYG